MRTSFQKSLLAAFVLSALAAPAFAAGLPEACESYTAAVTGGPLPPADSETVVIRWLGNANYEFAYKGKVYLFDAYFDRTPRSHKLGFTVADIKTAAGIFVSHAHFDHISDIGPSRDRPVRPSSARRSPPRPPRSLARPSSRSSSPRAGSP